MKRILFLFAGLVALSTSAFATNTTISEADASINNYVRGYGNSFIFNEAGIEFSIFADGQFDFYMSSYGPDVNVGLNTPGFNLSFNSGYDYNPYVQYDGFGAIIQIENTHIYYDYYGRVNQIGDIFVNYNGFGRINRVGGLNVYYRNNVYYRCDGFINIYNRAYVYRPWHRYYAVPAVNFCIVNVNPYRQYYAPVRHVYFRPYTNNVRNYNVNGRRGNTQVGRRNATTINNYAQSPRNKRERSLRTRVQSNNAAIASTRATRLRDSNSPSTRATRSTNATIRTNTRLVSDKATPARSNTRATTPTRTTRSTSATTRTNSRDTKPSRTERSKSVKPAKNARKNVTRTRSSVSNKVETRKSPSVRKPKATKSRTYTKAKSQNTKQRSVTQNKKKSSSATTRSKTSRKSDQSSKRSGSRRSRG